MDTTKPVTHVSLCAGYGGIDLGLKRAIPNLRTIAFSEIEAFACANLVAKMEAGCLDAAPIWTDVKTFPWEEFRGKVDIVSGGYPCQPFSAAGKRLGKDDPRHLWPWIADGIRVCRPAVCFFENVEGHISLGLREVIGELEEIGYRATWGVFSAAEVGAPHQRKRVFILAHRNDEGLQRWFSHNVPECAGESFAGEGSASVADAKLSISARFQQHGGESSLLQKTIRSDCSGEDSSWPSRPGAPQFPWEPPRVVGDTAQLQRNGCDDNAGSSEQCQTISESGNAGGQASVGDTNGMGSLDDKQSTEGRRAATVAESSAGLGDTESQRSATQRPQYARLGGELCSASSSSESESNGRQTEPALGGDAHGIAGGMDYAQLCVSGDNRTDELRLLGNGVVPATAERAFRILSARFIQ